MTSARTPCVSLHLATAGKNVVFFPFCVSWLHGRRVRDAPQEGELSLLFLFAVFVVAVHYSAVTLWDVCYRRPFCLQCPLPPVGAF